MNKINELREVRAKVWADAKRFLDSHRGSDGCLSDEDNVIYEKMEADVVSLGKEIERLERQVHIDREVLNDSMKEMQCTMDIPIEKDRCVTLANSIQETNKILRDMDAELTDMIGTILGQESTDTERRSPSCLHEEAAMVAGLAYDCLLKVKRIKEGLI